MLEMGGRWEEQKVTHEILSRDSDSVMCTEVAQAMGLEEPHE